MNELREKIMDVLEDHDATVVHKQQGDDHIASVYFFSPAGEDFGINVWYNGEPDDFIRAFDKAAHDFDADEHAEMWIEARGRVNGVPSSIRELIDDADAIREELLNIAADLKNIGGLTMKVKDLIEQEIDVDVYDDVCDEIGIAFCGPIGLTEQGKEKFAEVMEYEIKLHTVNGYDEAQVKIDDKDEKIWKRRLRKAKEFFWAAAGYCAADDYDKWFVLPD